LMVLGFEFRVLQMLGRCSITWDTPLALVGLVIFGIGA
jgi:hypothetical protein